MPTALMPDRSLLKLVRKADSDALLLPPMELTRFWKLCCSEATAVVPGVVPVVVLVAVPVAAAVAESVLSTESMRSCSAAPMCPPWPWWPPCARATPEALPLDAAVVLELALALAVALVPVLLPAFVAVAAPLPVPWDCSAATRFWMKLCIACCGVCVLEDAEAPDVPVVPAAVDVLVAAAVAVGELS